MNKNNLNISKIETFINELIDNKVSENTFFGALLNAESVKDEWEDMVMVEIPNGIRDMDAYGVGVVLVYLYARPLSSGRKNVAVMTKLEQRLNDVIASNEDKTYLLNRRMTFTDYDKDINWHCNIVELNIQIF